MCSTKTDAADGKRVCAQYDGMADWVSSISCLSSLFISGLHAPSISILSRLPRLPSLPSTSRANHANNANRANCASTTNCAGMDTTGFQDLSTWETWENGETWGFNPSRRRRQWRMWRLGGTLWLGAWKYWSAFSYPLGPFLSCWTYTWSEAMRSTTMALVHQHSPPCSTEAKLKLTEKIASSGVNVRNSKKEICENM